MLKLFVGFFRFQKAAQFLHFCEMTSENSHRKRRMVQMNVKNTFQPCQHFLNLGCRFGY